MKFSRLPFIIVLLAGSVVAAAPGDTQLFPSVAAVGPKAEAAVKITPTDGAKTGPIAAGGFADLTVSASKAAEVEWRITPPPVQRASGLPANRLIFSGAGTNHVVTAWVVDFDAKTKGRDEITVAFAGAPGPQPTPDPGPQPKPDPAPVGSIGSFVVVEDTLKAGPWRGEILGSSKVEAWYRQLRGQRAGPIHLLVDVNAPSAAGKKWADKAAGKKLPYLFVLDSSGGLVKECEAPTASPEAFLAAFDTHVGERSMGLIMEAPKLKWVEFGSTPQTPIIPRGQWKPISFAAFLPPVYDQDGIGQCAASACCTAIETAARMRGTPLPKLSAGDLYSRVNGGRDRGSLLEDNLEEASKGVALASRVPYIWNGRKASDAATATERERHKIAEAYWCKDFDAMASALQQGFIVEHGLMWMNNFKTDADGWLPSKGVGNRGGHALCGYGLVKRGDVWGIATRNSWSSSWGNGGDCIIPESLFGSNIGGFFAVRVVTSGEPVTVRRDPFNLREFALAW